MARPSFTSVEYAGPLVRATGQRCRRATGVAAALDQSPTLAARTAMADNGAATQPCSPRKRGPGACSGPARLRGEDDASVVWGLLSFALVDVARLRHVGLRGRRSQLPKKLDHRGTDFARSLLLGPVTASRQHDRSAQPGNEFRNIGNPIAHPGKVQHDIAFAGYVERRYGHFGPAESGEKLPVSIDVAIPIETTLKCVQDIHLINEEAPVTPP